MQHFFLFTSKHFKKYDILVKKKFDFCYGKKVREFMYRKCNQISLALIALKKKKKKKKLLFDNYVIMLHKATLKDPNQLKYQQCMLIISRIQITDSCLVRVIQ